MQDVVAIGKRTRAGVAPTPGKPPIGRGRRKKRPATDEYQICHLVMGFPRVIEPLLTWLPATGIDPMPAALIQNIWRGVEGGGKGTSSLPTTRGTEDGRGVWTGVWTGRQADRQAQMNHIPLQRTSRSIL